MLKQGIETAVTQGEEVAVGQQAGLDAFIAGFFICPKCGMHMRSRGGFSLGEPLWLECATPGCDAYLQKFAMPKIRLDAFDETSAVRRSRP